MMTGCCAWPARSAAFRSKGFGEWEAARNSFIMFTDRCCSGPIVGINRALLLLDHDRPSHLRVNGAKIGISAGSARCYCELLIRVERGRFLKLLLDAHDGVRFFVPIDPGHLLPRLHAQGLGIESEIFDLYSILLGGGSVGVLHLVTECDEGQIEKTDAAQQGHHFIFVSKCNHSLSRSS